VRGNDKQTLITNRLQQSLAEDGQSILGGNAAPGKQKMGRAKIGIQRPRNKQRDRTKRIREGEAYNRLLRDTDGTLVQ